MKGFPWGYVRPLRSADNTVLQVVPNAKERMEVQHSSPLWVFMIRYKKEVCVWESSLHRIYTLGFITQTRVLTSPHTLAV
jgi:hypothetical protein